MGIVCTVATQQKLEPSEDRAVRIIPLPAAAARPDVPADAAFIFRP